MNFTEEVKSESTLPDSINSVCYAAHISVSDIRTCHIGGIPMFQIYQLFITGFFFDCVAYQVLRFVRLRVEY